MSTWFEIVALRKSRHHNVLVPFALLSADAGAYQRSANYLNPRPQSGRCDFVGPRAMPVPYGHGQWPPVLANGSQVGSGLPCSEDFLPLLLGAAAVEAAPFEIRWTIPPYFLNRHLV